MDGEGTHPMSRQRGQWGKKKKNQAREMGEDRRHGVSGEIKFTSDPPSGSMRLHRTWEFLREEGKMGRRFGGSLWVLSA